MDSNSRYWFVFVACLLFCSSIKPALIPDRLSKSQATETQEIIEGDIVVDSSLKKVVEFAIEDSGKDHSRRRRDVVTYHQKKWRHAVVPFVVDPSVGKAARKSIQLALHEFHENTCLWFTPRRNETDYVRFVNGRGCSSRVGREGGEQIISIGPGCIQKATIMHELMHAVGFFHENSRFDRDHYIKVLWWNIQEGAEKNFLTYNHGTIDALRLPYDIHSLMHYSNKAFTKNFADTIQALEDPSEALGGKSLSTVDIKQILSLYRCKKPRYRLRRERCQDKHKVGCLMFLTYPEYCGVHRSYTSRYCKRTCRHCEASLHKQ